MSETLVGVISMPTLPLEQRSMGPRVREDDVVDNPGRPDYSARSFSISPTSSSGAVDGA